MLGALSIVVECAQALLHSAKVDRALLTLLLFPFY